VVTDKLIIGRVDKADFPQLHLENIDIKIDTGAYTSSIHCHHIKETSVDGEPRIEFQLFDPSHAEYNNKTFSVKEYEKKTVKNSFGQTEDRYVFKTVITLFDRTYPIDLSLSERSEMKYPVLIGRKLLNRRFLVNTARKFISHKLKQKNLD
jgi:hypothetical protein